MRPIPVVILALTLAATAGAASAQTQASAPAQAAVYPPPRFLPGFTHPDLNQQCQTVNTSHRECTVPANVGGRYLVEAVGFATPTAPDATLAMVIGVGDQVCITGTNTKFTGRGALHLICETTLATDTPIKIVVNLVTRDATLDAGGPKMVVRNLPWDGVVSVRGGDGGALPAPATAQTPAAPAKKSGH